MWLNAHCLVLLDMFCSVLEIGLDWNFPSSAQIRRAALAAWSVSAYVQRHAQQQRTCSQTAILSLSVVSLLLLGQRCQNCNFQAALGQSSSWVLAAGWARDVGPTPSTTAALRQGALWQRRIKVSYVAHDVYCSKMNLIYCHLSLRIQGIFCVIEHWTWKWKIKTNGQESLKKKYIS